MENVLMINLPITLYYKPQKSTWHGKAVIIVSAIVLNLQLKLMLPTSEQDLCTCIFVIFSFKYSHCRCASCPTRLDPVAWRMMPFWFLFPRLFNFMNPILIPLLTIIHSFVSLIQAIGDVVVQ
uniref:Uncharacterized protein n=1 Tax=Romanomermis culicivorax TaxID=13658 RepID=A0A915I331_ROMCU